MGKKILVVDDEKDLVETISFRLKANGYTVVTAYDGLEAIDLARRDRPDLIILDLMLPKMDGYKVCALLKRDARYAAIPIIIFTARAQDEDISMGKEMGADAYLTKPFAPEALLNKISELLKT
jgi:DNA-binding response OmpR family regulator